MNAIAGLFGIIPGWIWAAICAALFGWGGVNAYRVNSVQAEIAELKADHALAVSEASRRAQSVSNDLQRTKDEAIAAAEKRAFDNAKAAGRARSELDGLRNAIAATPDNSDPSCKAIADRASTLGDVFGECAGELTEMARKADGHVNDLRTYQESWPALRDFNDKLTTFTDNLKGTK